ncbi:MAG: FtsX-like permease family protein, partial [Acidobacteria bacterium]|nr:FtsX-like permease family protein [Acidobacteriota bacterium]
GVAEAAPVTAVPVTGSGATTLFAALVPEGRTVDPGMGTGGRVSTRGVTPGYFSVMGIPIVRGRAFEPADRTSSDRIAILDETLARRLFPNEDAVGKRFRWGSQYTVIGISRPARNTPMMVGNEPELYTVWKQGDGGNRTAAVMVRAAGDPAAVGRMIHAQVAAIDAEAPVTVSTLSQALGRVLRPARVTSLVVGSFALAGLLLTALGQFGVISQLVTQRRREIGIRIAVGARPEDAAGLVLRQALVWTAVGAALGIAGAIAAARPVNVAFPGPAQTVTGPLIAALVVLGGVSLLAAWRPAARAARVNPVEVLRCD